MLTIAQTGNSGSWGVYKILDTLDLHDASVLCISVLSIVDYFLGMLEPKLLPTL